MLFLYYTRDRYINQLHWQLVATQILSGWQKSVEVVGFAPQSISVSAQVFTSGQKFPQPASHVV